VEMQTSTTESKTVAEIVGNATDIAVGEMKMRSVGEHRVVVVRTSSGIHALDNVCPHQGYGLATGAFDGELITCQWHNWKFDARTGECLVGEENVACHGVEVADDGEITVTVTEPTSGELRERLWPSLARAIDDGYVGQLSRDAIRLLGAGASVVDIMWAGLEHAISRAEYGPGHELALATDCLSIALSREDDARALPLVQGLAALAEESRDRPQVPVPAGDATLDLLVEIEAENVEGAMAATVAMLERGTPADEIRRAFIEAASQHHLGYGHGIIYTQKAFELLDMVGWNRAVSVLPHLARSITMETREDLLPYMRKVMRLIDAVDLDALAASTPSGDWETTDEFVDILLDADDAPIERAIESSVAGGGIAGLLDAVSIGASRRLLRHDLAVEFNSDDPVQWLSITHALTVARATRWAWSVEPGPAAARLALFAVWLLHDSGRAERRHGVAAPTEAGEASEDLALAVRMKDVAGVLGFVREHGVGIAAPELLEASLRDPSGAFIVLAHLVKLIFAAIEESESTGSDLPLLAAARYLASPRQEAFVVRNVEESLAFVQSGSPPRR